MSPNVPNLTLSNGVKMPAFGLGTWQSSNRDEVINAVKHAIRIGYRLIDTAANYMNELDIGEALADLIKEGVVKREDVFITTKCRSETLSPADQEPALRDSLKKLGVEYVDLYLAHMPTAFNADMTEQLHDVTVEEIWKGLEKLYDLKLTRAIGISNFSPEQVERILKIARVPIHNHQVELHLYFQQKRLQELGVQHKITLTAYAPIGSPGRSQFVLPSGKKMEWPDAPPVLENELVKALAKKYAKTPAQVLLRHLVQNGIAVIPKSVHAKRIEENFNIWDFELTSDEVAQLNAVPQLPRLFWQDFAVGHKEDPFAADRAALKKA